MMTVFEGQLKTINYKPKTIIVEPNCIRLEKTIPGDPKGFIPTAYHYIIWQRGFYGSIKFTQRGKTLRVFP